MIKRHVLTTVALLLTASVFSIGFAELALEAWFYWGRSSRNAQVAPSYPTSFHTASGEQISRSDGYLKLALHPFLGYRNLPNQATPYFTINGRGFRGREVSSQPTTRRVVLVGGSAAFGTGLHRDEDTFAVQLERTFPGIEVVDAAVVGHQSGQEYVYLVTELLDLSPELVIALDGWNDYYQAFEWNDPPLGVSGFDQVELELRRLHRATTFESPRDRLFALGGILLPELRHAMNGALRTSWVHIQQGLRSKLRVVGSQRVAGGVPPEVEVRLERVQLAYERNLLKMMKVSRVGGGQFLSVIQPIRHTFLATPPPGIRPVLFPKFRKHVATALRSAEIPFIDLNEAHDVIKASMFLDDVHLNAEGNAAMVRLVADTIRARRLLQDPPLSPPQLVTTVTGVGNQVPRGSIGSYGDR